MLAVDVSIFASWYHEGGSMTARYRSEFTKIVKKDGFAALVQTMRDKLAKGDV